MLNASQYATLMNEAADYAGQDPMFANTNLGAGTTGRTPCSTMVSGTEPPVERERRYGKSELLFLRRLLQPEGIIGGNYDKSNYERLSFRSNTMYTLFDETKNRNWLRKLTFGLNVSYSRINSIGVTAG